MTVDELRKELLKLPDDAEVVVNLDPLGIYLANADQVVRLDEDTTLCWIFCIPRFEDAAWECPDSEYYEIALSWSSGTDVPVPENLMDLRSRFEDNEAKRESTLPPEPSDNKPAN